MAIEDDVRAVFEYRKSQVLLGANESTVNYGLEIAQAIGVRSRTYGGNIGRILGETSRRAPTDVFQPWAIGITGISRGQACCLFA